MKTAILCLVLVFGCYASAAPAWVTKKQYDRLVASWPAEGARPSEADARDVALAYFNRALKDPFTARYEWGSIEQGTFRGFNERFGATGWILGVDINAKNSFGAYGGFTPIAW